jgi:capsid protein
MGGDVFFEITTNPLKVSLIPPDAVDGLDARYGVFFNEYGEPTHYAVDNVKKRAFTPESGGILHVKGNDLRVGQIRGVPILSPVLEHLYQLRRYALSELNAAVITSRMTMAFKADPELRPQTDETRPLEVQDAQVVNIYNDEDLVMLPQTRPNANMTQFVLDRTKEVCATLRMPSEVVMVSYGASYTAPRIAILEAQRTYERWRNVLQKPLRAIYSALGFQGYPTWFGDPAPVVDPIREVQAAIARIDNDLSTRTQEALNLTGMDFADIVITRKLEEEARKPLLVEQTEEPNAHAFE